MIFILTTSLVMVMIHISFKFVKFVKNSNNLFFLSFLAILTSGLALIRVILCAITLINFNMAILILISIAFGKRTGLIVGCLFCFISNFFLGQGIWTVYQMIAYGYVGLISGAFFEHVSGKGVRVKILIFGFFICIVSSFFINVTSYVLYFASFSLEQFLTYYTASLVIDFPSAVFTSLFLFLFSNKILKIFSGIKKSYMFKL